jgi:hypothetical protein
MKAVSDHNSFLSVVEINAAFAYLDEVQLHLFIRVFKNINNRPVSCRIPSPGFRQAIRFLYANRYRQSQNPITSIKAKNESTGSSAYDCSVVFD